MLPLRLFIPCLVCLGYLVSVQAQTLDDLVSEAGQTQASADKKAAALKIFEEKPKSSDPNELERFYRRQEAAAISIGDFAKVLENAKAWHDAVPEDQRWKALWQIWGFSYSYGNADEAIAIGEKVIEAAKGPLPRALTRIQLAGQYLDLYRLEKAEKLIAKVEEIYQAEIRFARKNYKRNDDECGADRILLLTHEQKARLFLARGSNDDALKEIEKGLSDKSVLNSCPKAETPNARLSVRNYIGLMHLRVRALILNNRPFEADLAMREAIELTKEKNLFEPERARILGTLAGLKAARGQWKEALQAIDARENDLKANSEQINVLLLYTYLNKLDALSGLDRWNEARQILETTDEAIGGKENFKRIWNTRIRRAFIFYKSGAIVAALKMSSEGYQITFDRFGAAHFYTTQASGAYAMALFAKGETDKAKEHFQIFLEGLAKPSGIVPGTENIGLSKVYNQLILHEYLRFLDAQFKNGDLQAADQAFKVAEYSRGSSVQKSISEAAARSASAVPGLGELVRQEQDGKKQIAALYDLLSRNLNEGNAKIKPEIIQESKQRISTLEANLKKLDVQILKEFPDYASLVNPRPPSLKNVADQLQGNEAFISILVTPDRSYAWAIAKDKPVQWVTIDIKQTEVDALVGKMRKTLDLGEEMTRRPLRAYDTASAYAIYRQYLAPTKPTWQDKTQLIISPSGKLGQIPFGALLTRGEGLKTGQYGQYPWLVKDAGITHIPSVSAWMALKLLPPPVANRKAFIGYGDPLFAVSKIAEATKNTTQSRGASVDAIDMPLVSTLQYNDLPPLPETKDEILAMAQALNANMNTDVILGDKATRRSVLQQNLKDRRIIAFSTHGLVAGDLPKLSQPALAMAGTSDPNESPLLTLEDVMRLKLDADWVILSACNTASSDGKGDEALSGLGRGFFYAGARALLATHWSVESDSARELMTKTFTLYGQNEKLTRAEAIRQAQLNLTQTKFSHPFYWSAYALIGDGGR